MTPVDVDQRHGAGQWQALAERRQPQCYLCDPPAHEHAARTCAHAHECVWARGHRVRTDTTPQYDAEHEHTLDGMSDRMFDGMLPAAASNHSSASSRQPADSRSASRACSGGYPMACNWSNPGIGSSEAPVHMASVRMACVRTCDARQQYALARMLLARTTPICTSVHDAYMHGAPAASSIVRSTVLAADNPGKLSVPWDCRTLWPCPDTL